MNGQHATPIVRVLTVHQPHAYALVVGAKDVENRPWRFLAPAGTVVAILAGRGYDPPLPVPIIEPKVLVHRAIIGSVVVVGSHAAVDCLERHPTRLCSPWARPDANHWEVAHAVALDEPLPARGTLHLAYATPEQTDVVLASRRKKTRT